MRAMDMHIERIVTGGGPSLFGKNRANNKSCSTINHESDSSSSSEGHSIKQSTWSLSKLSDSSSSKKSASGSSTGGGTGKNQNVKSKSGKKSKRQENLSQLNKLVEYLQRDVQPKPLSLEAEELELALSYKKHSTKLCEHCLNHANLDDLLNNQPGFRSASSYSPHSLRVPGDKSPTINRSSRASTPKVETDPSSQLVKCYNCQSPISTATDNDPAPADGTNGSVVVGTPQATAASSSELNRPSKNPQNNIASWIDNEITCLIRELEAKKRLVS